MKRKVLTILVAIVIIVSMLTLVACGGNVENTAPNKDAEGDNGSNNEGGNIGGETKTKLATPTNINYTKESYKFTWDEVANADSYNINVTSEGLSRSNIENNEFGYYPVDCSKDIIVKVQAVDSTGRYLDSDWSEEKSTLMDTINNYAKDCVRGEYTGFVTASTHTDDYNDSYVFLTLTSKLDGVDMLTVFESLIEPGTDLTSLEGILKTNPKRSGREDFVIAVNDKGEIINSMDSLLQSDLKGTGLFDDYLYHGYFIEVLSSYTALDNGDPTGKNFTIHAVVEASRGWEYKYLQLEYDCRIKNTYSTLEGNVTTALTIKNNVYLEELQIEEITGDFKEAAELSANVRKPIIE